MMPALGLVIEHRREIARQRHADRFFDSAIDEELIEQCGARLIDHALAPPSFLADDRVESCPAVNDIDIDHVKADLHLTDEVEYSNQVSFMIVGTRDVRHQLPHVPLPWGDVERAHYIGILEPIYPPFRSICGLETA